MKHFYRTKDIDRIFGIGRETLRHYEKLGMLSPHINPENGYREYGYWDIGMLVDILRYRSIGLSLKDTKKAIYDMDFPEVLDTLNSQRDHYEKKLRKYELLLRKTKHDCEVLEFAKKNLGKLFERELNGMVMVPYLFEEGSKYLPSLHQVLRNSVFFDTGWCFHSKLKMDMPKGLFRYTEDEEEEELMDDTIQGLGFFTAKEYMEFLGIEAYVEIPKRRIIAKIVDLCGKEAIHENHFIEFEKEVEKKYKNLSDETYVILLSRFYDNEKRYHQYLLVYKQIL